MGNRSETTSYPPVINPADNPFLHIFTFDWGRNYRYIANLEGVDVHAGQTIPSSQGVEYGREASIFIPILPEITSVPPPEMDTVELVEKAIQTYTQNILELLQTQTNILACSHGNWWEFLPEIAIARLLESHGYKVQEGFPRTGGRKRIQEHAVIFSR